MKLALLACAGLLLTGCSTYQAVTPVDRLDPTDPVVAFQLPAGGGPLGHYGAHGTLLCVVVNPVSGNDFVENFLSSLRRRNFEVKVLQAQTSIAACPMVALYSARGAWYWNAYLNTADITVFRNGDRVGKAIYNANRSSGGLNLSNFVQPSSKLDELVEQLFPGMLPPPEGTAATPAEQEAAPAA